MADQDNSHIVDPSGEPATAPPPPKPDSFETYYDEEPDRCWRPGAAMCGWMERMRDEVLRVVPTEVTEHLVNSQKELIRAGIALAERRMKHADEAAERARELHKTKCP